MTDPTICSALTPHSQPYGLQSSSYSRGLYRKLYAYLRDSRSTIAVFCVSALFPYKATESAPVPVRFPEGVTRGFLELTTPSGTNIASGDVIQTRKGNKIKSRMVFRFKDGSSFDESVVFIEKKTFLLEDYRLSQKGRSFSEDINVSFNRPTGAYVVTTRSHENVEPKTIKGKFALPEDVYNGMVITAVKNLPKGQSGNVHVLAFTPEPLLVELEVKALDRQRLKVGSQAKNALHYILKPHPGPWLEMFAKIFGRMPHDYNAWIITDGAPAFALFEGPLDPAGPTWRVQLASPRF